MNGRCAAILLLFSLVSGCGSVLRNDDVIVEAGQTGHSSYSLLPDLNAATKGFDEAQQEGTVGTKRDGSGRLIAERLATLRSFVGDTNGAMMAFDVRSRGAEGPSLSKATLDRLTAVDAISEIVNEAKNRQIVILNEVHHVPLHRAFAMRLARELRKIGYEYLACETLSDGDAFKTGSLNRSSGFYSVEPLYGEFLRDALRQGWKPVTYDAFEPAQSLSAHETLEWRERTQAENLVARIFEKNSAAKVFIYAGGFHGDKRPNGNSLGIRQMGAQLRELTGLDPLTVDQTTFYEHPDRLKEKRAYDELIRALHIQFPSVLKKAEGGYFQFGLPLGAIDLQVVHPRYGFLQGRPAWLERLAERKPVSIPPNLLSDHKVKVIHAFYVGEDSTAAVPVDTVLLEPGTPAPALMLPAGHFRLEYED